MIERLESATNLPRTRLPRYVEILKALQADIARGEPEVGQFLPSEAELCRRFSTSRFTVREALRRLQDNGMVERTQGAGSRVVATEPGGVFVQNYRSVEELNRFAHDTRLHPLGRSEIVLDEALAAQVGGARGEVWTAFQALRHAPEGGPALALLQSHVPMRLAALIPDLARARGPIYTILANSAGEPAVTVTQETQALAMPAWVADALGVSRGSVSLRILRRYSSARGTLIATFNWHLGGDRYVHRTNLSLRERQP